MTDASQGGAALVHNHGPEDGPGLACREYRIGGRLIGECQLQPDRTIWNCRACWPRLCRCPDRTPPEQEPSR